MSSSRNGYHHGDLAHALETAAMRLLEEKPAAEISLREVARAAEVSHNAPYHHFADRRGLLGVLAERSMSVLLDDVSAAIAGAASPGDRLRRGGIAYIRFAVRKPHAFEAVYDPTVCVPGSPTPTMAPLIEALETELARVTAEAGLADAADAAGLWGLMHGLATLASSGHLSEEEAIAGYSAVIARAVPEA